MLDKDKLEYVIRLCKSQTLQRERDRHKNVKIFIKKINFKFVSKKRQPHK